MSTSRAIGIFFMMYQLVFWVASLYGQENKYKTKLYFLFGFDKCNASVTSNKTVVYHGKLTSLPSSESGCAKILVIEKKTTPVITLNLCGKKKILTITNGRFYTISIIDNEIIIEELDYEPLFR